MSSSKEYDPVPDFSFSEEITSGILGTEELAEHRRKRLDLFCMDDRPDLDSRGPCSSAERVSWLPERKFIPAEENRLPVLPEEVSYETPASSQESPENIEPARPEICETRAASDPCLTRLVDESCLTRDVPGADLMGNSMDHVRRGKKDMLLAIIAAGLDELLK